jgi:hypothetical protein
MASYPDSLLPPNKLFQTFMPSAAAHGIKCFNVGVGQKKNGVTD